MPAVLVPELPHERSKQYVVYSVLDAMLATTFDALEEVELTLDEVAAKWTDEGVAGVPRAALRSFGPRLTTMRRWVGAEQAVFERVGVEIGALRGFDTRDEPYFDAWTVSSVACWLRSTPQRTRWGCCWTTS